MENIVKNEARRDFLKVGGYSRSFFYFKELNSRMDKLSINDIDNYRYKNEENISFHKYCPSDGKFCFFSRVVI